ncbi:MAG: GNAT family N-acetyltransferase [archaeon]
MPKKPELKLTLSKKLPKKDEKWRLAQWRKINRKHNYSWNERKYSLSAKDSAGKILGCANFKINGGVGYLKDLIVSEDSRKKGVGTLILGKFEAVCRKKNCHKLQLKTADFMARPFYERNGFVCMHTFENDCFKFRWYLMEKLIG